ncbi:MAG: alpha/beta hydrolase [Gammaproteobacteria bacterium]|jgi:pimeloyl-ACP methyl ester carboxylesterase|nr:alpha/beta hydrolase [Gammaproteobacteria bacterium]
MTDRDRNLVLTDAADKTYEEHYVVAADGVRLYCRDYPNPAARPPVLCLPGLTRNCRDFSSLAMRIAETRRVICPDLRGRGKSQHDPEWRNYHPRQYAEDLWQLLDTLGVEETVVIGTSLGGWMAMLLNHQSPGRIAAAVMNDIGPEADPRGIARITATAGRLEVVGTLAEAIEQAKSVYSIAYPDWNDQQWQFYTETTYRQLDDGRFDLNFDRNVGHAAREGVSGLDIDPWAMFDDLAGVPTLLIHGVLSDLLTEPIIARMRERKPDLKIVPVSDRGHAPLLDEQEAVDAIATFLESV